MNNVEFVSDIPKLDILLDNVIENMKSKQDFKKGRVIYKNGLIRDKHLIHFPFISDKFLSSSINFFSNK